MKIFFSFCQNVPMVSMVMDVRMYAVTTVQGTTAPVITSVVFVSTAVTQVIKDLHAQNVRFFLQIILIPI